MFAPPQKNSCVRPPGEDMAYDISAPCSQSLVGLLHQHSVLDKSIVAVKVGGDYGSYFWILFSHLENNIQDFNQQYSC